jgi:hypothetical protein
MQTAPAPTPTRTPTPGTRHRYPHLHTADKVKRLAESEGHLSDAIVLQEEYGVKLKVNASKLAGMWYVVCGMWYVV